MRKSQHILILAFLILSLSAAAFAADTSASSAGVVNINTADATQLSYLPRVGAKLAQRIVDYRKEHGPFHKTTDLMQVKGVGDRMFERLNSYITVDGKTTLAAKVASPRKSRKTAKASQQPTSTASK